MNRIYYYLFAVVVFACQSTQESNNSTADSLEVQEEKQKMEPALFSPQDSLYRKDGEQVMVAGYIQTSGLENIQNPAYDAFNSFQLISLKNDFFLKTDVPLRKYWGKCVLIKGRYPDGWDIETKEIHQIYTFNRSALIVEEISGGNEICEHGQWSADYQLQQSDTTVQGVLERHSRPSPDIGYDYKIKLEQPVDLPYDDTMTTSELPVISNIHYSELEQALQDAKSLKFRGAITYGYAESMVFHLTNIETL